MSQSNFDRVRALTAQLNRYRYEYYSLNAPTVSDEVYDRLFDELKSLEQELGIRMGNSPTQTVGWPAVEKLQKTVHTIPLLSMDKTKRVEDLCSFMGDMKVMLMPKLDGLTVKLTYLGGSLQEAATRGNGNEGEAITHNVRGISGIPTQIPHKGRLVVTGEAFIRTDDFEAMKAKLLDSGGQPYRNGRNLAAGSVRLLKSEDCRDRHVTFIPFSVLEGFDELENKSDRLRALDPLGFQRCPFLVSNRKLTKEEMESGIQRIRKVAENARLPIDGVVVTYNSVAYSKGCGRTGHHYKDGIAFKFEDDLSETKLRSIEWTPSRSGEIAPVAIFETVEIDGCAVSRASLHNLSFIEDLELMPGNRILVSKRNMIIPHVEENLDRGGFDMDRLVIKNCPCCGQPTRIHENNGTKTLFCDNPDCATRRLKQFVHFVGEKAMNIEGLSENTLEKLIGRGLLKDRLDIYRLDEHRDVILDIDGFGGKSWQKLWEAIGRSRDTTFERYLIAMDIPMIGNTASRALARRFHSSLDEFEAAVCGSFDFTTLPDFGGTLHQNITDWFSREENWYLWWELRNYVTVRPPETEAVEVSGGNPFAGMTIVVTGKVEPYTRNEINAKIESLGAVAGSSVTRKTNYLICGDNAGSKLDKARELGVPVLKPAQFFEMAGI